MALKKSFGILAIIFALAIVCIGVWRYQFFYHILTKTLEALAIAGLLFFIGIILIELDNFDKTLKGNFQNLNDRINKCENIIKYFEDHLLDKFPELKS